MFHCEAVGGSAITSLGKEKSSIYFSGSNKGNTRGKLSLCGDMTLQGKGESAFNVSSKILIKEYQSGADCLGRR